MRTSKIRKVKSKNGSFTLLGIVFIINRGNTMSLIPGSGESYADYENWFVWSLTEVMQVFLTNFISQSAS
jgi:hypothetical protein